MLCGRVIDLEVGPTEENLVRSEELGAGAEGAGAEGRLQELQVDREAC